MKKRMIALLLIIIVLIGVFPITTVSAGTQAAYYISPSGSDATGDGSINNPWQTVAKARDAVRTVNTNMTGDIYVYLRGGTYTLSSSLVLNASDSGTNGYNIIYKAYAGETPGISGGQDLSGGWTLYDASKNIYRKTGVSGDFRQLYIGGTWAVRSREPDLRDESTGGDYYTTAADTSYPFNITAQSIGSWANNGACEFVWINHWSQYRGRINNYTVSGDTATIYFKSPESGFALNHHNQGNALYYYFENAYELLDTEGEWYHDTASSTLYYKPRSGEDMSALSVIAPSVESLVRVEGTTTAAVHNVQFHGIEFKHNNWTGPSSYGYIDVQAGFCFETSATNTGLYGNSYTPIPGMVDIKYANHLRIERCVFTQGGSWGIMEKTGCDHNTYVGNAFSYLASGAIALGNDDTSYDWPEVSAGTASHDVVKNNLVEWVGFYYKDAVGILALKTKNVTIESNEVRFVPYTAISIGLEWNDTGAQDAHDNDIIYNRIHSAMMLLDDGGGIYSLGKMPNSHIEYNYVYNVVRSPYNGGAPVAGIYLDNGSCYKYVRYNVMDQTNWATYAANAPNHDNIGTNNYYNTSSAGYTSGYSVWTSNTSCYGTAWSQGARDTMKMAGIESAYRDIGDVVIGQNLAIGGTASASSVYTAQYAASMAKDNNCESGLWASDAVQTNPWWQIDLGAVYRIDEVDIVARPDMDQEASRKNFAIWLSNDSSFTTYKEIVSVGDEVAFANKGVYAAMVDDANAYRYVRIQRINGAGHFNFGECKVYGGSDTARPQEYAPPVQSNLRLWLKADAGVTLGYNSNLVSVWEDQSSAGNDAVQGTGTNQPQWVMNAVNYKPSVRFDGVNDFIVSPGVTGSMDAFTVLFVIKPYELINYNNAVGASGEWGEFDWHGSATGSIYAGTDIGTRFVTSGGVLVSNAYQLYAYVYDHGDARLYKNGVLIVSGTQSTPTSWTGFQLGNGQSSTIDGEVPEVLVYNTALSAADRQNVENYLAGKYGF